MGSSLASVFAEITWALPLTWGCIEAQGQEDSEAFVPPELAGTCSLPPTLHTFSFPRFSHLQCLDEEIQGTWVCLSQPLVNTVLSALKGIKMNFSSEVQVQRVRTGHRKIFVTDI